MFRYFVYLPTFRRISRVHSKIFLVFTKKFQRVHVGHLIK